MRIGLFTDTYPPDINGVANSTHILFGELKRRGHDVFVVTTYSGIGTSKWDENHEVLRLGGIELPFLYGYSMTSPIHTQAIKKVDELNLDIIHVQTEFGVGIFAHYCSRHLGIPIVSTYHTTYEDYTHYVNFLHSAYIDKMAKKAVAKLSKVYGNSVEEVIVPSEKTKELLENYDVTKDIHVIPTGLVLSEFDPKNHSSMEREDIREEFGFENDDIVFVYVGRIAKEKSLDMVIQAFHLLHEKLVPVKLLIIGGGPGFDDLVALNQKYGNPNVKFAGIRASVDVPDFYNACDAFVSASLSETQGITFIEALASGLPVYARDREVLEDLLVEGETGWYFDNAKDLASLIQDFLKLTTEQKEVIHDACIEKAKKYGVEFFGERILKIYEEAIQDYQDDFEIVDAKGKNEYVYLTLRRHGEEETLRVTEDDYYLEGLRKQSTISSKQYYELKEKAAEQFLYNKAIRRLSVKDYSQKEMMEYLLKDEDSTEQAVLHVLGRLNANHYLDDERYAAETLAKYQASHKGKNQIYYALKKKGIDEETIQSVMANVDAGEEERALESANQYLQLHDRKSMLKTKTSLQNKLFQMGYDKDVIESVISRADFSKIKENSQDNLRTVIAKAKARYEKKYQGYNLKQKVYQYCLSQGYPSSEINTLLETEDILDEEN